MNALRFHTFGSPDVLTLEDIEAPRARDGQAVVAVRAASINPSDVGNVAGRFDYTTLPRTPGRDYAGVVIDGPAEWLGAEVWGTGDGGFMRDGSHAERILVPAASLCRKPASLSFEQAASVGVMFVVAWMGLVEYADLKAAETLVVIGAGGGVGNAAIQIGRYLGATVIGFDRTLPAADSPARRKADRLIIPSVDASAEAIRDLTDGRGADVVLNAVGGPTFEPSLAMLAHRGRLAVLASPAQRRPSFDLLDFYHNESQLFGVDSLKRDMSASAALVEALVPGFEAGVFEAPPIERVIALDQGAAGYAAVAQGTAGRVVIVPDLG